MIDISKKNCAVATTTVERDTLSTPFDSYRKITARDNLKRSKDGFERQVFAMRVNATKLLRPSKPYCEPSRLDTAKAARPDHTDKMGLSGEVHPPGLTDAPRISLCYYRRYMLDNCHERHVAVLA